MKRKREPVLEEVAEGGWIVRHTHDVELAAKMLHEHLAAEYYDQDIDEALRRWPIADAHQVWRRIVPALPNSWAAAEGYSFWYGAAQEAQRGAFPAVEWFS